MKLGFFFLLVTKICKSKLSRQHWQITILDFFAYIDFLQNSSLLSQKSFAPWRKENRAILKIYFCQIGILAGIKKAPKQTTVKKDTSPLANAVPVGIRRS